MFEYLGNQFPFSKSLTLNFLERSSIGNKLGLTFVVYNSSNTNVGLNRIVRC